MNIVNEHKTANILAKGNEPETIKPLDPAVNLQKIQRTENVLNCTEYATRNLQSVGNYRSNGLISTGIV